MARLFFALQPEAGARAALHEQGCAWSTTSFGRALGASDLHLTLCFVGNVPDGQVSALCGATACVRANAVELSLDALDFWPGARVICAIAVRARENHGVVRLSEAVFAAVTQAGFAADARPFRPHITLVRNPRAITDRHWPQPLATPIVLRCDRFALLRSDAGKGGTTYTPLQYWPLMPEST
jgi:RNA 2',3'-cyclic 3'-phosphodiesterase